MTANLYAGTPQALPEVPANVDTGLGLAKLERDPAALIEHPFKQQPTEPSRV
jgi:hypothetical protein